ncbi:unnamed protein product, partial [Rotaria sp. Silwood2]
RSEDNCINNRFNKAVQLQDELSTLLQHQVRILSA